MKGGLFREKELTLDRMAEVLGTNRTYVSNALNKVAGISFYGYIDSYRIKEATRVLSDPGLAPTVSSAARRRCRLQQHSDLLQGFQARDGRYPRELQERAIQSP